MILEAETRYAKIEKDEKARGEIDRSLEAAIAARSLPRLEALVKAAAAAGVNRYYYYYYYYYCMLA